MSVSIAARSASAVAACVLPILVFWRLRAVTDPQSFPSCGAVSLPALLLELQPAVYCGGGAWPCAVALGEHERDRAGSQVMRRLRVLVQALSLGCEYIHTPLRMARRESASGCTHEICGPVEKMLHIGDGCDSVEPLSSGYNRAPPLPKRHLPPSNTNLSQQWRRYQQRSWLLGSAPTHTIELSAAAKRRGILALALRRDQRPTPWFNKGWTEDHVIVAVHVRRGDLVAAEHISVFGRWVPDAYYEAQLPRLALALRGGGGGQRSGRRAAFHIVSEGASAWASLQGRWKRLLLEAGAVDVSFHIDEEPALSLSHLIEADVLVQAPSFFSSVASTLSIGVIVTIGFQYDSDAFHTGREHQLPSMGSKCTCTTPHVRGRLQAHNCSLLCAEGREPPSARRPFESGAFACDVDSLVRWKLDASSAAARTPRGAAFSPGGERSLRGGSRASRKGWQPANRLLREARELRDGRGSPMAMLSPRRAPHDAMWASSKML